MPENLKWKAELVRLTGIFDARFPVEGLFEAVTGVLPDNTSQDRKLVQVQESGALGDQQVLCISSVNRFDVILPYPQLQLLEFDNAIAALKPLVTRTFERLERPSRLAFGAVLHSAVPTREEGYLTLDRLLPGFHVDPTIEDFMLQVNRPRDSATLSSQRINRLCRWSVGVTRVVALVGAPTTPATSTGRYACRLELDINTNALQPGTQPSESQGTLSSTSSTRLEALWAELVSVGQEIAAQGDIK